MGTLLTILMLSTFSCAGLAIYDCAMGPAFETPSWPVAICGTLMVMYAVHLEKKRWQGQDIKEWEDAALSFLLYFWLVLYLVLFIFRCFFVQLTFSNNLAGVALLAIISFFGSETSKNISGAQRERKHGPGIR